MNRGLTAAEVAVFLGVTAAAIRQVVKRRGIVPTGKQGRAHLYDPHEIIRHAGGHDRRAACEDSSPMSQ